MKQNFFDWEPSEPEISKPAPAAPAWQWHEPWAQGLTDREYALLQIRRDLRAAAEEQDPWWKEFFLERVELFRKELV